MIIRKTNDSAPAPISTGGASPRATPPNPIERSPRQPSSQGQIARALGGEILAGIYGPGELLPCEAELLARFNVSRTVLREVIKTLAAKGLISSRTGVGTKVLPPSAWNYFDADVLAWKIDYGPDEAFLLQLAQLRRVIAPAAAGLAAARRDRQDIDELHRGLAALREAGPSRQRRRQARSDFHRAVATASGNALMTSIAVLTDNALAAGREGAPAGQDLRHHEDLVTAIEAGDADTAASLMRQLIDA